MRDYKNVKLANQVLQIVNCSLNARSDLMKGNNNYPIVFKTLLENSSNFIVTELLKDLPELCKN